MVCVNATVHQHKYSLSTPSGAAFPEMKTIYHFLNELNSPSKCCTFVQELINTSNKSRNVRYCFTSIFKLQNNSQIIILLYT